MGGVRGGGGIRFHAAIFADQNTMPEVPAASL